MRERAAIIARKTYKQALREAGRVGAANATGDAHLAQMCALTPIRYGAVSPKMIYEGAQRMGISGDAILKMSLGEITDLMWSEPSEERT